MSKRINKKYTLDLKLKAVQMYLEAGIGSTTIAKELDLSDHRRVIRLLV